MPISPTSCAPMRSRARTARAASSAATSCSTCALPRLDRWPDGDPAQIAHFCTARPSLAAAARADVECRLAPHGVRAAGPGRRGVAVAQARAELHRRAARRAAHRPADSRQAGLRRHRWPTPACCRRCCATRCCARSRTPPRGCMADETGADLQALLRDAELVDLVTGAPPTNHWKRQLERTLTVTGGRTIREFLESQTSFTTPALAALGEFRSSLAHLQTLDSEAIVAADAGHARPLGASARRLDHLVRDQAPRRRCTPTAAGAIRRRLRLGREPEAHPRVAREAGPDAAARRSRAAADAGQRQRLHPRAVDDACRDRGAAAQRAPRTVRRSEPPPDRSRSTCRRAACARRRGCSTACGRASRSARCSAIASSAGCTRPSSTAAAAWTASSRRCGAWRRSSPAPAPRRPGRSKPSPPTTSSTAWCSIAAGRRSAAS